jgi:hypothetical protein
VKGDAGLEGVDDESLLTAAVAQDRALLTNNVRDFALLARQWAARGDDHLGLAFTPDTSMPRARETMGLYVERLGELFEQNPGDEALRNRILWL